jgi:hypothetical protein
MEKCKVYGQLVDDNTPRANGIGTSAAGTATIIKPKAIQDVFGEIFD